MSFSLSWIQVTVTCPMVQLSMLPLGMVGILRGPERLDGPAGPGHLQSVRIQACVS
jgi:hypothetical protein